MNKDPNVSLRGHMGMLGGLTREQYAEIAALFPPPYASSDTTPTQAAWLLGTQAVLLVLTRYIKG